MKFYAKNCGDRVCFAQFGNVKENQEVMLLNLVIRMEM